MTTKNTNKTHVDEVDERLEQLNSIADELLLKVKKLIKSKNVSKRIYKKVKKELKS